MDERGWKAQHNTPPHNHQQPSFTSRFFTALIHPLVSVCSLVILLFYIHIHFMIFFYIQSERQREKGIERERDWENLHLDGQDPQNYQCLPLSLCVGFTCLPSFSFLLPFFLFADSNLHFIETPNVQTPSFSICHPWQLFIINFNHKTQFMNINFLLRIIFCLHRSSPSLRLSSNIHKPTAQPQSYLPCLHSFT